MGLDLAGGRTVPLEAEDERHQAGAAFRSGAQWFYWIAGLSVLNSALQLLGSNTSFIVGLGATQIVDALARSIANGTDAGASLVVRGAAMSIDTAVAAFFAFLGWQAGRRRSWAFLFGMVLYALDGLLFLLVQDWLSIGFHAFALLGIWKGHTSLTRLREAEVRMGLSPVRPSA